MADSAPSWSPSSALRALEARYPGKVPVHLVDGHAYVWRVQDASRLRSEHHICGLLSGTLPLIPQQNVFLGLPLQLFPEEVVYLIRKRAIILIADERAFDVPTAEEMERYYTAAKEDQRQQATQSSQNLANTKGAQIERLLQKAAMSRENSEAGSMVGDAEDVQSGAAGGVASESESDSPVGKGGKAKQEDLLQKALEKRLQREDKRKRAAIAALQEHQQGNEPLTTGASGGGAVADNSLEVFAPDLSASSSPSTSASEQHDVSRAGQERASLTARPNHPHVTSGSALEPHLPMDWYHPHAQASASCSRPRIHTTLSSAKGAKDFFYPRNQMERAKCAAFEDLQARGYYMGIGLRFGGDFVVYPGDPLRYHSHFTCTVRASPTAPLPCMELIANGRLGTAVKKAHLISGVSGARADVGEERGDVLRREDEYTHKWGQVVHFSLTWSGFGT
ncbi:hypothetical protein K437DRAFT_259770 [Tilletiaria anomala UBC 951]|uniref:tRNA-intron lyase n=1 Tax=Tilletiaria anomala (strain ATCC 24038 / CBS 436.72 / UBC 951) TaxID=1037660 RepID=A0A066VB59_TILAU|nr:uncharacterized protein K437DRAFT_259770 [Tilletiaria anomala UBC 951]KDN37533.1 hypothetical protein K437DRAFT_259770 [Tilletiaria anomala UBC 951]